MDETKEIWIFLSHSNKDFEKVRMIRNYLEDRSCRPLMFYLKCLSNDDEIDALIKREIDCRTRFIICESENTRSSKWVQSEVNYIKSQQRAYETVDLNKSDDEIKSQLDELVKSTQIYLSYSRKDMNIVNSVYSHIRKYDIRCMGMYDQVDFYKGVHYQDVVINDIDLASEFGFVVFFASERSLRGEWSIESLAHAANKGAKILVLLMDDFAKMYYKELFPKAQDIPTNDLLDRSNDAIKVRDLTVAKTEEEMVELAIEKIVDRAFAPWTTYTMAKNLLEGIDCPADPEEAERLFKIVYKKCDELDTIGYPGGTLFVARCMANGYGTEKDLHWALCYYHNYIGTCGSNETLDKEIEAVRKEFEESSN